MGGYQIRRRSPRPAPSRIAMQGGPQMGQPSVYKLDPMRGFSNHSESATMEASGKHHASGSFDVRQDRSYRGALYRAIQRPASFRASFCNFILPQQYPWRSWCFRIIETRKSVGNTCARALVRSGSSLRVRACAARHHFLRLRADWLGRRR